jgi:hypothetical protein
MQMFGDSFDYYATVSDMGNAAGFWDLTTQSGFSLNKPGRFGGQCLNFGGNSNPPTKTSGANDAVHHLNVAIMVNAGNWGPANEGVYFTLYDGATAQCTVAFWQNGNMTLHNGAYNGTTLATFPGAIVWPGQWMAIECEIVIHPTAGSITVRTNNSATNTFQATALNTRNSANSYANKIVINCYNGGFNVDDFLWRSDPASVPWVGDVRPYVRAPSTDVSAQFSRVSSILQSIGIIYVTSGGGYAIYSAWSPQVDGNLTSIQFSMNSNYTGNVKVALFDATAPGGNPGNVLASGSTVTNPTAGVNVWNTSTFTPIAVKRINKYFVGLMPDGSATFNCASGGGAVYMNNTSSPPYASFPISNPPATFGTNNLSLNAVITTTNNNSFVGETPEDSTTTYVWDSTAGQADFYGFSALSPVPPGSPICLVTRGFIQKSDAGSRTGNMQLKSGATTVQATTSAVIQTAWTWQWRMDLTDPNTGAAWTQAAIDAAQIGPIVIS